MSAVSAVPDELIRSTSRSAAVPEVSVLVPVKERPEPLDALYREYSAPFLADGTAFEFVFLIEPWGHGMIHSLAPMIADGEPIRVLEVGQDVAESALLQAGAQYARGEIVLTLPAYRRVEAYALPALVAVVREGADVAVARRWPRHDSALNRLQNRALHSLLAGLSGNRLHDVACGVRALRREVLLELPIYGDLHRFLPLFALREGLRVSEISAPQHPGDQRTRLYGPTVYLRRLVDLLGLFFLLRFTEKPLRFFGMAGSTVSGAGAVLLLVLLVQRLAGQSLADRPLLVLSVMLLVLGVQAIALGLIGEIVVHLNAPSRRPYRLAPIRDSRGDAPPPPPPGPHREP
jgi:hypothetical protein